MGPSSRPMWPGQLELWIFFFFFLQKPSLVPVTGGTLHLRPRGHDGPGFQADVARSAGALDLFFFFSSRSPLVPVTGGTVHLRPRGHYGPGFQADVARSAGALDLFFFFFFFPPEALSVPVTGGPVRLRPRESYGRGFLSLTCRSYQFSRLSGRPVVPLRSGSFRYGVIFGPPPQV